MFDITPFSLPLSAAWPIVRAHISTRNENLLAIDKGLPAFKRRVRYGAPPPDPPPGPPPLGGLLRSFFSGLLLCVPLRDLSGSAGTTAVRRIPRSEDTARLTGVRVISSSLISSHWASVRCRSGIARSSCRR